MSENTQKWFQQPVETAKKKYDDAMTFPFSMEVDSDCRICILNPDDEEIPPVHYHNFYVDNKVARVLCTAAEHLGGHCRGCEYNNQQEESNKWKTALKQEYAYTILSDDYDEKTPIKKHLRLSTPNDHQKIKNIRETVRKKMGKKGLQYGWIEVTRPSSEDKAPRIGSISQYLTELDVSQYDEEYLKPFTHEDILKQFVYDEAEANEIYDKLEEGGGTSKKVKIRKV
jgi:hypothetical protein